MPLPSPPPASGGSGSAYVDSVLLVRPARFAFNRETAGSNQFQRPVDHADVGRRARAEFERVCAALASAGVNACIADDTPEPHKPDAVFPNNWASWHRDGTVVLYPMQAVNRRAERRCDVLEQVAAQTGFRQRRLIDLSPHERDARFLEGTGSLVLDHANRLAFACRSPRTDAALVREWAELMGFEPILFDARTRSGSAPYHTNVLLAIGARWVTVCGQAITAADRARVLERLRATGRELIEISADAMEEFGSNLLELSGRDRRGHPISVLAVSQRAATALRADGDSWTHLAASVDRVLEVAIPTIEQVGGGGVRCMLAEVPAAIA